MSQNCNPPIEFVVSGAKAAEEQGYDSIWYPDHLMGWFPQSLWTVENSSIVSLLPSPHLYMDPAILIALAGQATTRVMLGTGVTEPIRRPPAELARVFLTLSQATGGRAILGIGAGERENVEPYGLDYRKQASRLEEALHIIRLLWDSKGPVDFDGGFWKLRRAVMDLEPHGGVFPPIYVAAHGPKMLDITGRYGDGWLPAYPMDPSEYKEKLALIHKSADKAGRDPQSIVAAYWMYAIVAESHEAAHQILASPLAGALALVASSAQWERGGRQHPLGAGFQGLSDYVPEWYSKKELDAALAQYDPGIFHDQLVHGTPDEVVAQIEPYSDAGLEHAVFANIAPVAGLEYYDFSQEGLRQVAEKLKG